VIVVDANVLVASVVSLPRTADVRRLRSVDGDWHAPILWRSELRHVLTRLARQGSLGRGQAETALRRLAADMLGKEHQPDNVEALRIAIRSRLSAYDAEYVVVAQELGVPLVTSDEDVLAAFPRVAVRPEAFGS
jgi:predicted nucleic acid-binding protein